MERWSKVGGFLLLAVGVVSCRCPWQKRETIRAYIVHHGEEALRRIVREFERESGIRVEASFACRRALFQIVSANNDGDVCITSGQRNIERFETQGLSRGPAVAVGELTPAIQVLKGNPKKITSLADLGKPGVRVMLGRPSGCIGLVANQVLEKSKLMDKVAPNVVGRVPGDRSVAASVDGKNVDACIVWSWTTREVGPRRYDIVPIPPEHNVIDPLGAVVLQTGKNEAGAEKFVAFLQGERAEKILTEAGLMSKR